MNGKSLSNKNSKTKVALIGGGIFGATAAAVLAEQGFYVTLFEKNNELFSGASLYNHNRHHLGFHYPRSIDTARQCMESRESFNRLYSNSLITDFDNYYCVGRESRVSASEYLDFCSHMNLPFSEEKPPPHLVDPSAIALGVKVGEPIYNLDVLRSTCIDRLNHPNITVQLNHEVIGVSQNADSVTVNAQSPDSAQKSESFDHVVNATYARYNQFCEWLGFEKRQFQFNLQELCVLKLPIARDTGITIMDGEYPSFLPYGKTGLVLFAHVTQSQLVREVSFAKKSLLNRSLSVQSNWKKTMEVSSDVLPILKKAEYQKSFYIDRVVDARRAGDDGRISEVISHSDRCWSIFSAKIITSVSTADSLAQKLQRN
jgi:hypothetical protein